MCCSHNPTLVLLIGGILLATSFCMPAHAEEETTPPPLKVGFAERDITPDIGMEQPGGYGKSYHRTFHDPCKVRAVVFDDGQKRVALVGVDALAIHRPQVTAARKAIQQRCGIEPEAVLIGASHSHSSGPTCMVLPGEFDHASPEIQELAYKKSSMADAGYLEKVVTAIVDAVADANEKRAEAACGVGSGIEDKVAFNRRFRMKNGQTNTHPRPGNPDIVEVAGPTDPEVGVIGVWNSEGKLLGCVVNYACHATTSPGGISANWIYYMEQVIRGAMGPDAVVVFLAGCSGDVTQVDNLDLHVGRSREEVAQFVGGRVGAEAVKVLLSLDRGSLAPLDFQDTVFESQRRIPNPARVEQCRQLVKQGPKEVGSTEWTFAKEIVLLDVDLKKNPTRTVEVQAIQMGPAVFVSSPAEYFCQFGLDIKKGSSFLFTFPVSLANGCVGYVPTEEALGEHGGGYETRLTAYSNLVPSAGRKIADTGIALTKRMKPGRVPERAKLPPFKGTGWTYGNVPPELE